VAGLTDMEELIATVPEKDLASYLREAMGGVIPPKHEAAPGRNAVAVDARFWASWRSHLDTRLRADARGRDGGVREKLAAGVVEADDRGRSTSCPP
jgi:hypothetical protein